MDKTIWECALYVGYWSMKFLPTMHICSVAASVRYFLILPVEKSATDVVHMGNKS